jgi:RNA polymerase sigma factor (sigma-70 family)
MDGTRCEPATDSSPMAALYQAYAPGLLTYAHWHTASREDAEDIVLAVFVAALESNILLSLSTGEQAAWLWRVTKNKAADYQRRVMRHAIASLHEVAEAVYVDDGSWPDEVALRNEEYTELRKALGDLPEVQQEILLLRFGQGLRCKEIAQRLNKGEGAVRMLLSRSLNFLRRIYDQQPGGLAQDE